MNTKKTKVRVLVIAPLMHYPGGHFSFYAKDLAYAFLEADADVTLAYPHPLSEYLNISKVDLKQICISKSLMGSPRWLRYLWIKFCNKPIYQCIAWLLSIPSKNYDFVYWSDFEANNQRQLWPLSILKMIGIYRHKTAFTEHHEFAWRAHQYQRLLGLDRLRLNGINMFVMTEQLLGQLRNVMHWQSVGFCIPHGLWPDPISERERDEARHQIGISRTARVLLVFGTQCIAKKKINRLAQVIQDYSPTKPLVIIFAGASTPGERHPFLDEKFNNTKNIEIIRDLEHIPEIKAKLYFAAADAVWANYGDFVGASGVLAKAIAHGRAVIGPVSGASGLLCAKYGIGVQCIPDDEKDLKNCLSQFIDLPHTKQRDFEQATAVARAEFAWPNIARQILTLVQLR